MHYFLGGESNMERRIITSLSMSANWYELLQCAKEQSGYHLKESVEHYLIMTLDSFNAESHDFASNLAIEFMEALDSSEPKKLRSVGDKCLLINGVFPEISIKRNVTLSYYAGIGKQAYSSVAQKNTDNSSATFNNDLFNDLSIHFVGISDLMHLMLRLNHKTVRK